MLKWIKYLLAILVTLILCLIVFTVIRTFLVESHQLVVDPVEKIEISDDYIQAYQHVLQQKTISFEDGTIDTLEFDKLHTVLKEEFPVIYEQLEIEYIQTYGIIWHWKGSDTSLKPIILMAHQDVVPIDPNNVDKWTFDPWKATIHNDTIYGRGTLDDKAGLVAQLTAIESLLKQGFRPKRSVYLVSGMDEEIGGEEGAKKIAKHLKSKGVQAQFVLDEGLYILDDFMPGLEGEVAFIGLAEKGYLTIALSIEIEGGHSSIPGKEHAIDILGGAVHKIKNNPLPARLTGPTKSFLEFMGPEMPFIEKLAFANNSLLKPLIINSYEKTNTGNAIIRTTTATTIFRAGEKNNVIPTVAKATINFRLLPGDTKETVLEHVHALLPDNRIQVTVEEYAEPSKISSADTKAFTTIHATIKSIFPEVYVAPNIMVGGSDSKHFENMADQIYRFRPLRLNKLTISGIHGYNERIAVEDYKNAIRFYMELIKNVCA